MVFSKHLRDSKVLTSAKKSESHLLVGGGKSGAVQNGRHRLATMAVRRSHYPQLCGSTVFVFDCIVRYGDLNSSNRVGAHASVVEVGVLTAGPQGSPYGSILIFLLLWKSSLLCGSGHMLISSFHIHAIMLFIEHLDNSEAVK